MTRRFSRLRRRAKQFCVFRDSPGRSAAGGTRSQKQCVAAIPVPSVFAGRVCARENVGAVDFVVGDDLGASVALVCFSVVSGRREVVHRQPLDGRRDLHREFGLDTFVGVALASDFRAGQMACGRQRCSSRFVLHPFDIRRSCKPDISYTLGSLVSISANMQNILAGLLDSFSRQGRL